MDGALVGVGSVGNGCCGVAVRDRRVGLVGAVVAGVGGAGSAKLGAVALVGVAVARPVWVVAGYGGSARFDAVDHRVFAFAGLVDQIGCVGSLVGARLLTAERFVVKI